MLSECCTRHYPLPSDEFVVKRRDGKRILFRPFRAVDILARHWRKPRGPSSKGMEVFASLSWTGSTIAEWNTRIETVRKSRSVSRKVKVKLLSIFNPVHRPSWKDAIPIRLTTGDVWVFKPVQWMDDITNVWLGGKISVRLTDEERLQLESLPWFRIWIDSVREKREKRRKRREERGEGDMVEACDCGCQRCQR